MAATYPGLIPYKRAPRPPNPASFPQHVDSELERAARVTAELVRIINAIDARLIAGGL